MSAFTDSPRRVTHVESRRLVDGTYEHRVYAVRYNDTATQLFMQVTNEACGTLCFHSRHYKKEDGKYHCVDCDVLSIIDNKGQPI